jgi:hypothetical protein
MSPFEKQRTRQAAGSHDGSRAVNAGEQESGCVDFRSNSGSRAAVRSNAYAERGQVVRRLARSIRHVPRVVVNVTHEPAVSRLEFPGQLGKRVFKLRDALLKFFLCRHARIVTSAPDAAATAGHNAELVRDWPDARPPERQKPRQSGASRRWAILGSNQ